MRWLLFVFVAAACNAYPEEQVTPLTEINFALTLDVEPTSVTLTMDLPYDDHRTCPILDNDVVVMWNGIPFTIASRGGYDVSQEDEGDICFDSVMTFAGPLDLDNVTLSLRDGQFALDCLLGSVAQRMITPVVPNTWSYATSQIANVSWSNPDDFRNFLPGFLEPPFSGVLVRLFDNSETQLRDIVPTVATDSVSFGVPVLPSGPYELQITRLELTLTCGPLPLELVEPQLGTTHQRVTIQ